MMAHKDSDIPASSFDLEIVNICENLQHLVDRSNDDLSVVAHDDNIKVVAMYNDFVLSLKTSQSVAGAPDKFKHLLSFLCIHFTVEEKLMKIMRYPGYDSHRKQHAAFVERMNSYVREISAGDATIAELVMFMGHWLLGHTLISDKAFGDFEEGLVDKPSSVVN